MTVGEYSFVKPDSALLRAAEDLMSRHTAAEPGDPCVACGQPSPCASARHAFEVHRAAGVEAPTPEPV